MRNQIHQCSKCSEFLKYTEESFYYFGLLRDKLYTDDTYYSEKKPFLRCSYCYTILDSDKTLKDRKPFLTIVRKGENIQYKNELQKSIGVKAIELNLVENYGILGKYNLSSEQEKSVRIQILLLENNKRRDLYDGNFEVPYNEMEIANLLKLEKLLTLEDGKFLVVEIKRYLGQFAKAKEQLDLLCDVLNYNNRTRFFKDKIEKENELIEFEDRYVSKFEINDDTKKSLYRGIKY